jgi:LacI family transcriptional regulator
MAFDNYEGARLATRHLLELGHQKIACITGPSDHSDAVDRLRGCQAEMKAAGLSLPKELIVEGDFLESGGVLAVQKLLASRATFTAILALNDQSAYGAALALYRSGLRVPDDISLVGFDDLRSSSFTIPPLTTVRHAIYEIGQQAALAVVDLVEGRKPTQRVPVPELVVRESTRRLRR